MNVKIVATNGSKISNVQVGGQPTGVVHLYWYKGYPVCAVGFFRRLWFRLFGFVAVGPTKCDLVTCSRCTSTFDTL